MNLLLIIVFNILLLSLFIAIVNKITVVFFIFLRKRFPLKGIISSAIHAALTGLLSGLISVIGTRYVLHALDLSYDAWSISIAAVIIIIFYIAGFYISIRSGQYFMITKETALREKSGFSTEYQIIQHEKSLKISHAWSVIGIIIGFTAMNQLWYFFEIDSLILQSILAYLFLGLLSSIEFSGRYLPGAKGYMITFIVHLFMWPLIRFP